MKTVNTKVFCIENPIIQDEMHLIGFAEMAVPVSKAGSVGNNNRVGAKYPRKFRQCVRSLQRHDRQTVRSKHHVLPTLAPLQYTAIVKALIDGGVKVVETAGF